LPNKGIRELPLQIQPIYAENGLQKYFATTEEIFDLSFDLQHICARYGFEIRDKKKNAYSRSVYNPSVPNVVVKQDSRQKKKEINS